MDRTVNKNQQVFYRQEYKGAKPAESKQTTKPVVIGNFVKYTLINQEESSTQLGARKVTVANTTTKEASNSAFNYAFAHNKNNFLQNIENDESVGNSLISHSAFNEYKLKLAKNAVLFDFDSFAEALNCLVIPAKDNLKYKESYIMKMSFFNHIVAFSIEREQDDIVISFYNPLVNLKQHHQQRFSIHNDIKTSLQNVTTNIADYLLQNLAPEKQQDAKNSNVAIYSTEPAEQDFNVTAIGTDEKITPQIINSSYSGVPPKSFNLPESSNIDIANIYSNLIFYIPKEDCKQLLSAFLSRNRPYAVNLLLTNILQVSTCLNEQERKNDLLNLGIALSVAFKLPLVDGLLEFNSIVIKSDLTNKSKGEILINSSNNNNIIANGLLSAIIEGNDRTNNSVIKYIAAIFNNCTNGDDIYEIVRSMNKTMNKGIKNLTLFRFASNENNFIFFNFLLNLILTSDKLNVGHKVSLLLDTDNGSQKLVDYLVANNKYDLAKSYLIKILDNQELDNNLKINLLDSKELGYYDLTLVSNQIDAIFKDVKSILSRTDISTTKIISILKTKPASKLWKKLFNIK